MVEMAGIPKEKFNMTCSSVDKLDKEPWEVVRKELIEEKGISEQSADFLGNYVVLKDKPRELLNLLRERKMFDGMNNCIFYRHLQHHHVVRRL